MNFLTIDDEGRLSFSPDEGEPVTVTEENYKEVLTDEFFCSSSIDFAHEYTKDQAVIDLIRNIRTPPPICPPVQDVEA